MNYCSSCGSDKLVFEVPEGDHRPRFCCNSCGKVHYQNPRVVVGCIALWQEQVLLCRRAIEPRKDFWNLPGGYLENGETVEAGALRETREETGAEVKILRLHSVYNLVRVNQVFLHFLAEMQSPAFYTTAESSEVKLFPLSAIPWQDIAFDSNTFALTSFLENRHNPAEKVFIGTL